MAESLSVKGGTGKRPDKLRDRSCGIIVGRSRGPWLGREWME